MEYFFYSSIAGIALIVHLIINWRQLVDWRDVKSRLGALEFRLFIVSLLFFFVSDILWGVFALFQFRRLLYAGTILFFLTMAVSILTWTHYVVTYLEMGGRPRNCLLWTCRALGAFLVGALIVNGFNGKFFRIDADCVYRAGPLRQLALWLLIGFNVLSSMVTLIKLLRTRGTVHQRNKMVFAFGITMLIAILLQLGDAFLPLYSIGCLVGICLLHVFVIEEERDEMHRNELLARDYEAQLESERASNQAKSLFFSTVSHDIRTPLNAIVGFSELLEHGIADEEERLRCIASIRSSGKVLARLVDDILDLSKMESGRLDIIEEPTDIPTLAREVIGVCDVVRARKSLTLKAEIGEVPWVGVDPHRVRQLLFNLLSNAYKYTERGTITVSVRWRDDGTLTLSVADTGKGIAKEDILRILQPFVQVADRNHRDGTGLGLAICQRLSALMGGELTVASKVGVGSTFTITLRNVRTVEPPAGRVSSAEAARASAPLNNSQVRVLAVDDSSVNRAVLKAMLEKCGVTDITLAENGREALTVLENDPKFDMVLSDLWMPEMDGRALVQAIRGDAKLAHLPVYLTTADVEARAQAEADGFTGVIIKPITLDKLRQLFA